MNDKTAKLLQKIAEKKAKKKSGLDKLIEKAEKATTVAKLRDVVVEMMREND